MDRHSDQGAAEADRNVRRAVKKQNTPSGAFCIGPRIVRENCYDESKERALYKANPKRVKIVVFSPFISTHDFQRDTKYLELSRPLNFFDIEAAKILSTGHNELWASRYMYPSRRPANHHMVKKKLLQRRPALELLIEYFRQLQGQTLDPSSFTMDEAWKYLVTDIRAADAGKVRTDLIYRLIDTFGLQEDMRLTAERLIKGRKQNEHSGGADLKAAKAMVGAGNGAAKED